MVITSNPTAAASRPCALLPTQASPFTLPTRVDAWRDRGTRMPVPAAVRPVVLANHNSIAGVGYGAAKQAAPPRGVPR